MRVPLSWVGINAARVEQRAEVGAEALPTGTGEPDQQATLVNTPVIVSSVEVTVNGERWERIDDLTAAGPEAPARSPRLSGARASTTPAPTKSSPSTASPAKSASATVCTACGRSRGASIQARYAYGGGAYGNVGIDAVAKGAPAGLKARNPVPTWGGSDGETVGQAERRIPGFIRHRDRLVTFTDYVEITRATPGVDLGRVEVLPLVHPELAGAEPRTAS
ncbi:MAG: hypothetical protein MZW92_40875 [Comamonadaceae bacterium]|nr:hypothetical protein [Comamonadaceae bacterium]